MKKTIAILLVLILAGFGLFATGVDGSVLDNKATIKLTTAVTGRALFGVSESKLGDGKFADWETFTNAVADNITTAIADIDTLKEKQTIGWLSGFNNTDSMVYLSASATNLTRTGAVATDPSIELELNVDTAVAGASIQLPGATGGVRGKLDSLKIRVKGNEEQIGLAPVGTYTATITFTVVGS
ncbi:MAG: hypothetical protein RBR15_12865 [Sphaerochaeta sp.]|nr:hypothetical protein [Sphaerochaeta sp.]